MKKSDFNMFKVSLNLNIEVDNFMRRISEKIRLINQQRDTDSLRSAVVLLRSIDEDIDKLINDKLCKDE